MCDGNGTIAAAILRGIGHNHKAYVETSQPAKTVRRPCYAPFACCVLRVASGRAGKLPPGVGAMARAKMGDCGGMLQLEGRSFRLPHGKGC